MVKMSGQTSSVDFLNGRSGIKKPLHQSAVNSLAASWGR